MRKHNKDSILDALRARRVKVLNPTLRTFIKDECTPRGLDVVIVDNFGLGVSTSDLGCVFYEKNTIWVESGKDNLSDVTHEVAHWITASPKNRKKPNFGLSCWDYDVEELAIRVQIGLYYRRKWAYLKLASQMNMQEFYTEKQLREIAIAYAPVWDLSFLDTITDMGIAFRD